MSKSHEIIVVGGGHNGLTVAAYLAKAGLDVAVVEKKSYVGGGAVTLETNAKGFLHDVASAAHIFIQANPLIRNDELDLISKYGLKYYNIDEAPSVSVVFPDESYISLYRDLDRTCESIAKFSAKDAESYRKFAKWAQPLLGMLMQGFFAPPAPLGGLFAQLDQQGQGRDLIRAMQMSSLDIIDDWFDDYRVKATLARFVSEIIVSPDDIGTGVFFFIMVPLLHTFGMAIPEGGSGALSNALRKCIEANGGTVYVDSPVVKFQQSGGRVNAVVLASGEVIEGKRAVLANLNIKQIPLMLDEGSLDEEFLRKVKGVKNSVFSGLNINLSLNNAPLYNAGNEVNKTCIVELCDFLPGMRQEFDGFKYGKLSTNMPGVIAPTIFDKTRAPEGKHTLYMFQYNPFNVEGDSNRWNNLKDEATQRIIDNFRKHTTNMGDDNIVGKSSWTPLDLRNFNDAWVAGDPLHMRNMIAQFFSHRPFAEAGYYKLPVDGLYICGPSSHPGGGVTGGARAAAMFVMEELGIDFELVIEK